MKLKYITHSLVTRLIAMGLLVAIVATAASYWQLTRFLRGDLSQVAAAQQQALAGYVAGDIDDYLMQRQRLLEHLAASLPTELLAQPEQLQHWLAERHALAPLFSLGLRVTDTRGQSLSGQQSQLSPGPELLGALEGRIGIGRPASGPASQPVLPMAAMVRDGAGQATAVLIGTADLLADGLLERLRFGQIGQSGGILVVSPRDRLFVASTDPAKTLTATPANGVNLLHDRAMAGYRGSGSTVNAEGVEEISAIASVPSSGWFVVARLSSQEALATVPRVQAFILRQRLVGVLVAIVVLALIFWWLLRPLVRAATQAEKMTQGEIPLMPLRVVRDDEIGHLTAAFNRLLSKLGDHQAELGRLAYHDSLTGLPNRKLLEDRLQQALARAQRHGRQVALLYLDLDGFKQLNDTLGHEAGDEALQEAGRRLLAVVRQTDTVARLGGDEFVLLASDFEEPAEEAVRGLAQKCLAALSQPLPLRDGERSLGASIGVVLAEGTHSTDSLLAAADKAMYAAKQNGRGSYVLAPVLR